MYLLISDMRLFFHSFIIIFSWERLFTLWNTLFIEKLHFEVYVSRSSSVKAEELLLCDLPEQMGFYQLPKKKKNFCD